LGHSLRLLAVDDDSLCLAFIRAALQSSPVKISTARDAGVAIELAQRLQPGITLLDWRMPGVNGWSLFDGIRSAAPATQLVLMTGYDSAEAAVEAIRRGAVDYLAKPFPIERVQSAVTRILYEPVPPAACIIGESAAIKSALSLTSLVAPHFRNVLLAGPTGSGKELFARRLHGLSPSARGPYVAVNCAAVQETLFESELFGHVRGAFTGATRDKRGLMEAANGGVLFLDEVGELPLHLQAKLLRAIEERAVRPVGSVASRAVEVRVIAGTNRELRAAVGRGLFRDDLFYRLATVEIRLPALADRIEDLPLLVQHFVAEGRAETGRRIEGLTPEAEAALRAHSWPGNVRELRSAIMYACMVAQDCRIGVSDLPASVHSPGAAQPDNVKHAERKLIERVLAEADSDRMEAARRLGISRATLYRRLAEFNHGKP